MSVTLLVLGGVVAGGLVGWVAGRRAGRDRVAEEALEARPVVVPGLRMAVEPTLEGALRLLVTEAAAQVDVPCAVALRERAGGPIRIRAVAGGDSRLVDTEVDVQSLAGRIVTEGVPVVEPAKALILGAGTGDRRRPVTGSLGVPLVTGPLSFGALMAFGEPAIGSAAALARLEPLASGYAPVILPAMVADIEERRASTDALTGLENRRGFDKAMARLQGAPRALVAVDIDHFKAVNDEHSHAAGDQVLRSFAKVLKEAVRAGDVAARIGGEEFAVILPGADLALGVEVAERLRTQVAARTFFADGHELQLTISCGVAASPVPVADSANLAAVADAQLYQAKRAGRNQVVVAETRGVPEGPRTVAPPGAGSASPWVGPVAGGARGV